ncbi:hypothetical protein [Peribacillus sp. FSL M8-0224]|uniref:hypothetical protein n=1 Tax=Peribacillus sp. FSL M8-0224 TaxID=2921568 RepID=UPI0030FBC921
MSNKKLRRAVNSGTGNSGTGNSGTGNSSLRSALRRVLQNLLNNNRGTSIKEPTSIKQPTSVKEFEN